MSVQHHEESLHGSSPLLDRFQEYLSEFVYGGIDGSVTTFAVVAGSAGAGLDASVVIILGFANLIADGFSMSVGSYLSNKSEKANYEKHKQVEYWEVEHIPEKEREEIREIYQAKGFEGELLEQVVSVITADKDRWVDVMMKEELEMIPGPKSPFGMALATFIAFVVVGLVPLLIYVFDYLNGSTNANAFLISSVFTSLAFVGIGYLKAVLTASSIWKGVVETLFLGASAAALAYWVGNVLQSWLG